MLYNPLTMSVMVYLGLDHIYIINIICLKDNKVLREKNITDTLTHTIFLSEVPATNKFCLSGWNLTQYGTFLLVNLALHSPVVYLFVIN